MEIKSFKKMTGVIELILGIPLLGATIVMGLGYFPLLIMLILHIAALIASINNNLSYGGSVMGIVTSCLAWIPFLGLILHIITAFMLFQDSKSEDKPTRKSKYDTSLSQDK